MAMRLARQEWPNPSDAARSCAAAEPRRPINWWWAGPTLVILLWPVLGLTVRLASYLLLWLPGTPRQRPARRVRRVRVSVAPAPRRHTAVVQLPLMPRPARRVWQASVGIAPAVAVNARTFARNDR